MARYHRIHHHGGQVTPGGQCHKEQPEHRPHESTLVLNQDSSCHRARCYRSNLEGLRSLAARRPACQ